jgi:hypothetical protein
MKKQNGKKAAAKDRETNGNGNGKAKVAKPEAVGARYTIGVTETVKRGFLKEMCDFTRKKGTVTEEMLVKEFVGRTINKHPIDKARMARYIRYCINNGQFKEAK